MGIKKGDVVRFKGSNTDGVVDCVLQDVDSKEYLIRVVVTSLTSQSAGFYNPWVLEVVPQK